MEVSNRLAKLFLKVMLIMITIIITMPFNISAEVAGVEIVEEVMNIFDGHDSVMLLIEQESGEIIYGNQAAADFYQYAKSELTGLNINDINNLSQEEVAREMMLATQEERNYFEFEHRLADGNLRHVEVHSYPQTYQGRNVLFSIIHDSTERVELAEQNRAINRNFFIALGSIILILLIFSSLLYRNYNNLKDKKQKIENFNKLRQTFIDADDSLIYLKDDDLNYIFVNQTTANFYNMSKNEIIGKDDYQISDEMFARLKDETDRAVLEQQQLITDEVQWNNKFYKTTKFPVELLNGNYGVGAYIKDVTEEYMQKSRLAFERNKYLQTLLSIGDGVIVVNKDREIEMINKVAQDLTGWHFKDAHGKDYREVLNWDSKDNNNIQSIDSVDPIELAFITDKPQEIKDDILLVSKNGKRYYLEDSAAPIKDDRGNTRGVVFVFRDATEIKKQKDRIEYLSYHDSLTGLYNRRFFQEELKRVDVARNLPLSIIIGDLDGLKLTNDIFGHTTGDNLICNAAETFKEVCREDDIIARWGGDEFIILLPQTTKEDASKIVDRIKKNYADKNLEALTAAISMGFATKDSLDQKIDKILDRAETLMYSNKTMYRNNENNKYVEDIINNLYTKSPAERRHAIAVKKYALKFADYLELSESEIERIEEVAYYHDIGKVAIDSELLNKVSKLTVEEYEKIKLHPVIGYRILNYFKETISIAQDVLYHHERWDGSGYPKGLAKEKIPIGSRMIALVEAFEIMTSDYSYKKQVSCNQALDEIETNAGSQFDPELAREFIKFIKDGDDFNGKEENR